MPIKLYDHQTEALGKMRNGCILCGGVGTGKSRTALAYYYTQNGGQINPIKYVPMKNNPIQDLYVITTARKRDTKEWELDMAPFLLGSDLYSSKVVVDSWNNIGKYEEIENAFFIFDEQRVVGYGAWSKTFIKIARKNNWILLSATPGDTWLDYAPVFIANGFYKNITEFKQRHVVYKAHSQFPQVDRYVETGRLIRLRNNILVNMEYKRKTESHHKSVQTSYDILEYKNVWRLRWDPYKDEPIVNSSELCYILRKICNSDPSRLQQTLDILKEKERAIIFYNFDYELEALKQMLFEAKEDGDLWSDFEIAEWNGHAHQPIPESPSWAYLVQYNAGAEGWNCITTDTIIFFSQTYSYKTLIQSAGRIDRLNTPFRDLYYYHLRSKAPIDIAIGRALEGKKKFNEAAFVRNS